jgi:hypothetical protein
VSAHAIPACEPPCTPLLLLPCPPLPDLVLRTLVLLDLALLDLALPAALRRFGFRPARTAPMMPAATITMTTMKTMTSIAPHSFPIPRSEAPLASRVVT